MNKTYNIRTFDQFIKAAEDVKKECRVIINIENDIYLHHAVEFSGCSNLEITSSNGASLTGGIVNPEWIREGDYLTFYTEIMPRMLIINEKPVPQTSFPADGYLENTDICTYGWLNSRNGGWDKTPTPFDLTHITSKPGDIPDSLDIENCDIKVIHQWDESTVSIKGYDASSGIIECENVMAHPAGAFGVHKYQFINTAYGQPQKGKWYYDKKQKKIYYCPADGECAENISAMIPQADSLIVIKDCKNVSVNSLNFVLSNAVTGVISGLRAINPIGAIQIEDSENVNLDMLEISFSGGQGIKCVRSKKTCITNSIIENCASCGIATFKCKDEYIGYNVISDVGLVDFSAVSIHAGGKSELVYVLDGSKEEHGQTVIDSNTIDGSPYCGITCNGGPHIIKNNKATRCMQILKDGGAIYCSRAIGTLVKDNYVSDVPSDTAYAYYLDELSENCVVDGNVSVNVNIPFNAHIAKCCTLSNNLFINNEDTKIRLMRSVDFSFSNNIIISDGEVSIGIKSYMPDENFTLKDCVTFDGDIICAPLFTDDNGEKINLDIYPSITYSTENDKFIISNHPGKICNKYIVTKTEPHCIITKVKPEKEDEYKKLHDEIWDMVVKNGHLYNVRNYSIFKFRDMYVSFFEYTGNDFESDMNKKAILPITKRWQKLCRDCFEEIEDNPEKIFFDRF